MKDPKVPSADSTSSVDPERMRTFLAWLDRESVETLARFAPAIARAEAAWDELEETEDPKNDEE